MFSSFSVESCISSRINQNPPAESEIVIGKAFRTPTLLMNVQTEKRAEIMEAILPWGKYGYRFRANV
jgi:hypothetical protein